MCVRILVALACVLACLPCTAAAQIGGGIKGGLTFGDVPNMAGAFDAVGLIGEQRLGFAAGGFLTFNLFPGFTIQPEVLYTQKGVKLGIDAGEFSGESRFEAEFVDVPILARLTFGKVVRGYVFGGPSMDFRRSAKMTSSFPGERDEDTDVSDEVEDFEFAMVFGGGVEFGPLLVEARWSEGLTSLAKDSDGGEVPELKTRTFLVLAGLRF